MASNKLTIEDMHLLVSSRGGKCLSEKYVNSQTKLEWECSEGHRWEAVPAKVRYGQWCRQCSGNVKKSIEQMYELAAKYGGKCMSTEYVNNMTPLEWICEKGHYFTASYSGVMQSINNGGFCSICGRLRGAEKRRNNTIEEMREIAVSKGGKCLSNQYINAHQKLTWECANEHTFDMNANDVKNGHWCPHCHFYLNENKCRYILEQLTGKRFKSTKKVLNGLELDGYNSELDVAFEYNGVQHYEYIEFFHRTYDEFIKRKKYDEQKHQLCNEKGIKLIVIPYTITDDTELVTFIFKKLNDFGIKPIIEVKDFHFKGFYRKSPMIKELSDLAKARNGKLLSKRYHNNKTKLLWECEYGHQWEMRPNDVKNGQWCSTCNGSHKLTIEEMNQIARDRNGLCLSIEYINNRTKLRWRCAKGHEWDATPDAVKRGTWCEICSKKESGKKRRLKIEEMHSIAKERGGRCLSTEYINNSTHLLWECSIGHTWKANANNIKSGTWCPRCKHKKGETTRNTEQLSLF
ncbi:hypothetical protein [Sporosarcina highlanderae]|uniref:Zinc-ribbon domain-containing protein n=1 Tax=Sporosarcina highlanderae TaxID=3035916 RepID=A0ABT8JM66_9BACL|nr:hypothetical protein [Sporosarcina highlanderae]MDN4605893.1 hypothetical protein [Sporosarcina highlanderae]